VAKRAYVPRRGDIVFVQIGAGEGHEQSRPRPALVLSPDTFNRRIGLALVAPITSRIRHHGFEVLLDDQKLKTRGAVLCQQIRTIDYRARQAHRLEVAPPGIVREALAKVRTLVS
jgi:mRNA interferase MazF